MTPTEWFDQFPPNPAMDGHQQWCARHWGPCPNLGANGILAVIKLQQIWLNEIATGTNSSELNTELLAMTKPVCCQLGDERMYEVWGKCPPGEGEQS